MPAASASAARRPVRPRRRSAQREVPSGPRGSIRKARNRQAGNTATETACGVTILLAAANRAKLSGQIILPTLFAACLAQPSAFERITVSSKQLTCRRRHRDSCLRTHFSTAILIKPAGAGRLSAPEPALLPSNSIFVVAYRPDVLEMESIAILCSPHCTPLFREIGLTVSTVGEKPV